MKEILCSKIETQQIISKVGESGNCNKTLLRNIEFNNRGNNRQGEKWYSGLRDDRKGTGVILGEGEGQRTVYFYFKTF